VAALIASAAYGTSVVPMTVATMADHAGQVITGDVASLRSYWVDQPRRIETEITFSGVGYLKGAPADADGSFILRVPGGAIGDLQMRIEGAPQFAVGESWVLFLLPTYRTFPVVGIAQGAYRVVRAADGVHRVYRGALAVAGVGAEAAPSYDQFVKQITPILDASRDHGLTEPAGRPVPVRQVAVPLQPAPSRRKVLR
jgi:hypothetical protein